MPLKTTNVNHIVVLKEKTADHPLGTTNVYTYIMTIHPIDVEITTTLPSMFSFSYTAVGKGKKSLCGEFENNRLWLRPVGVCQYLVMHRNTPPP